MEVVAIVALGRSAEQEAPELAAAIGVTTYEAGMILRAPTPMIVLRTDDHARALDVTAKLRARGHDAVTCNLDDVVSSERMFRPRSFRIYGGELVASGHGEEGRITFADIFALIRATHATRIEDSAIVRQRTVSLGRAAMTGGLVTSKVTEHAQTRVSTAREPVLYVFRSDSKPWLMSLNDLRFDGLGPIMKVSKFENFEVLINLLRESAPAAPFDARLLSVRVSATVTSAGANHLTTSSAWPLDILAHVVALSVGRQQAPYR